MIHNSINAGDTLRLHTGKGINRRVHEVRVQRVTDTGVWVLFQLSHDRTYEGFVSFEQLSVRQ